MTPEREPLVSVVMAAHNCEQFIAEAIESILAQTYTHLELLIVDDVSTDQTLAVAQSYAERDRRIRVSANDRRLGAAGTRNRALREARGEFIAILDADDVALPERLAKTVPVLLDEPQLCAVGTRAIVIDEDGNLIAVDHWCPAGRQELERRLADGHCVLQHSSVLARASALREAGGYDEFFRFCHDYDLWLRLSAQHEIRCLSEPLVKYRMGHASICSRNAVDQAAYIKLSLERARRTRRGEAIDLQAELERFRAAEERANPGTARAMIRAAHWHLEGGHRIQAWRYSIAALRANPLSLYNWAKFGLTLVPRGMGRALRSTWFRIRRRLSPDNRAV